MFDHCPHLIRGVAVSPLALYFLDFEPQRFETDEMLFLDEPFNGLDNGGEFLLERYLCPVISSKAPWY